MAAKTWDPYGCQTGQKEVEDGIATVISPRRDVRGDLTLELSPSAKPMSLHWRKNYLQPGQIADTIPMYTYAL